MSPGALKGIGIGCFVLCAILLFVAWERYQDNANKVEAANKMLHSSPFGGMMQGMQGLTGSPQLEPSAPAATKYALVFAVLSGIAGGVCFVIGAKKGPGTAPPGTTPSG
jgi:phage-related minor tail protein